MLALLTAPNPYRPTHCLRAGETEARGAVEQDEITCPDAPGEAARLEPSSSVPVSLSLTRSLTLGEYLSDTQCLPAPR